MSPSTNPFRYVWRIHPNHPGSDFSTVVEVRPRFGQVNYWQIAISNPASVVAWSVCPSGARTLDFSKPIDIYSGPGSINNVPVTWFGASARLTPWKSVYMGLFGDLPDFMAIGATNEMLSRPVELEIYSFTPLREWAMVVNTGSLSLLHFT